jgi:hypothetical protein
MMLIIRRASEPDLPLGGRSLRLPSFPMVAVRIKAEPFIANDQVVQGEKEMAFSNTISVPRWIRRKYYYATVKTLLNVKAHMSDARGLAQLI